MKAWPVDALRPTPVSCGARSIVLTLSCFQTGVVAICRGPFFDARTVLLLLEIWHAVSDPLTKAHPFGFRPAGVAIDLSSITMPDEDDGDDVTFGVTRDGLANNHMFLRSMLRPDSHKLQGDFASHFKTAIAFASNYTASPVFSACLTSPEA